MLILENSGAVTGWPLGSESSFHVKQRNLVRVAFHVERPLKSPTPDPRLPSTAEY